MEEKPIQYASNVTEKNIANHIYILYSNSKKMRTIYYTVDLQYLQYIIQVHTMNFYIISR